MSRSRIARFDRYVLEHATERDEKPALIDGPSGRTLTYGGLASAVPAAAAGLVERGLRPGDVVAIDAPNMPEYAVVFCAVAAAGGVNTTSNPISTAEELSRQLRDSGARFLVTIPPLLEKAMRATEGTAVEEIFTLGEALGATPFETLLREPAAGAGRDPATDRSSARAEPALDLASALVALPYSSGTTGLPKGVMLTHRNLVANMAQMLAVSVLRDDDVCIGILPFFHIYGMTVVMGSVLRSGGTVVTMPRFDLEAFLATLERYRVTVAFLVPPIILALAKHPAVDRFDLSALRWINSGAAPLGEELARTCASRLGCIVGQGYGLTETSPGTHCNAPDPSRLRVASAGLAVPNTEFMIVDLGSGEPKPPGEDGEVWIRGPQVMLGYLNQPEATARMLTPDGWLRTGDIGHADDDGYLYIVDRAKELIKYKGMQVAPAELEAVLLSHPDVVDAAVIGRPDPMAGEIPKAFVVLRRPIERGVLLDWVAERVAPYKKVRALEFRDSIPKSASGKILRRVLLEEERRALAEEHAAHERGAASGPA